MWNSSMKETGSKMAIDPIEKLTKTWNGEFTKEETEKVSKQRENMLSVIHKRKQIKIDIRGQREMWPRRKGRERVDVADLRMEETGPAKCGWRSWKSGICFWPGALRQGYSSAGTSVLARRPALNFWPAELWQRVCGVLLISHYLCHLDMNTAFKTGSFHWQMTGTHFCLRVLEE